MPLSEQVLKSTGMDFDVAAEEMRRLAKPPTPEEKRILYGLYKQGIHGDIPPADLYPPPSDDWERRKYDAWANNKGMNKHMARKKYVEMAEEMIGKYHRTIVRCKWNAEVWSVDY